MPVGTVIRLLTKQGMRSKGSSSAEGGYVEGVVTYMVMNDLVVRPMSKISSISLLNKFKFQDVGVLEERKSLILKWTSLFYSCKLNFKNYAKQRANEDEELDDDANLDAPTTLSDLMFSDTKGYGGGGAVSVATD
ncbi:hypothetical protein Gogos_003867 [Gossypium gossypioides]|uniref:Uncharacterized protein n=1 Tax=Gossypium gossypioides TaxID=34282 RepID=A0A7J9CNS2_GOSGO|nr:hypothetical protein [Gossypium gossypioides]